MNEQYLEDAEQILTCMMRTFQANGKFPRPEYAAQDYEYGWVSSMDAPVIMIVAKEEVEKEKNELI